MNKDEIIDHLTYASYVANRDSSPDITPKRWEAIYGMEVVPMETRYQADKAIAKARRA